MTLALFFFAFIFKEYKWPIHRYIKRLYINNVDQDMVFSVIRQRMKFISAAHLINQVVRHTITLQNGMDYHGISLDRGIGGNAFIHN